MLRLSLAAACALTFAGATPAFADSPFDGTWKAEISSAKLTKKPTTFDLAGGSYRCLTCAPPFSVPADGKPHPVADRDYWDAMSARIVDPTTAEFITYRKGLKVSSSTYKLSGDGNIIVVQSASNDNAAGKLIESSTQMTRAAPATAGSHALSGSWLPSTENAKLSDDMLTAVIAVVGDTVTQTFPTGETYSAKFGGPAVPLVGDRAGMKIMASRLTPTSFQEIDTIDGKALTQFTYTLVDPTTMMMRTEDKRNGKVNEITLKKQ